MTKITPANHVRRVPLAGILAYQSCPFRYWSEHLAPHSISYTGPAFVVRVAWPALRLVLAAWLATGQRPTADDVDQSLVEVMADSDLRAEPDPRLVELARELVQGWLDYFDDVEPLAVDQAWELRFKPSTGPAWTLFGRIALIYRTPSGGPHASLIDLAGSRYRWGADDLEHDLGAVLTSVGVQRGLGLPIPAIQTHALLHEGRDVHARVFDFIPTEAAVSRAMEAASAIRLAIESHLFRGGWWPNRLAWDCRAASCRSAGRCIRQFGPGVRP